MRRLFLFLLIAPLFGVVQSCTAQGTATRDISVLFIGNSYTFQHDIPDRVKGLAPVRDGVRIRYKTALIADGGVNLIKYVGFFKVICPDYNSNVYILSLIQNRIQLRCEMVLVAVNLIALMLTCANSVVLEMVKIGQNLAFL